MPNEGHRKPKSDEQREKEREYARRYYWAHREERVEYQRTRNPAHTREALRKSRVKLRDEIHAAYGNVCSCCGETEPKFLTIEHLSGGGREHRRQFGIGGLGVLYDIKKRGFPPEFTLFCFNCNCGSARNGGACPHKEASMTTRATLANGTTFDYDEETQAHPTGVNDQIVVSRVFTGPTPAKAAGTPGETPAQRRDRLRAELAALEDEEDEGGGTAAPDLFPPIA